jgi:molecular chaperone GrpE
MTSEADETQVHKQESSEGTNEGTGVVYSYQDLPLEEQVAALRIELEEARAEAERQRDLAQRAQADLINYRRRTDDERISQQQFSNSRLIVKLLPVVDELEMAVNHAGEEGAQHPWAEGVKLIQRKVTNLLESEGVKKIEAVGSPFDPSEHEAVGTEETTRYPSGHVMEVVRNGYRLHERVIQPAQVVVAREARQPNQTGEHSEL